MMPEVLEEYVLGDIEDERGAKLSDQLAEHRLLALMLRRPEIAPEMRDLVSSREFFDRALGRVFDGMVSLDGFAPEPKQIIEWLGGETMVIAGRPAKQFVGYLVGLGDELGDDDASAYAQSIFETAERRFTQEGQTNLVGLDAWQSKMGLLLFEDRDAVSPDQYDYLVEDLIPEQELTIIMGPSQAGKSFITYHLAMCVARGVPFFGRRILKPQPVVWCAYEGGRGARGRMLAYSRYFDVQASVPFAALTHPVDLWSKELNVDELIKEIDGLCRIAFGGQRPGAVIIDTHNAATPGASEIDSEVVSKIRDRYKAIIRALECSLIVIGHTNALGKHRGNEQLTNNVETVIAVHKKTRVENRQNIQIKDNDSRDVRTMEIQKQREGETGTVADFVLHGVETGIKNKFGKVRTSCVVTEPNWSVEPEKGEEKRSGDTKGGFKLTDIEDQFFKAFWKALHESGQEAPPELGLSRSTHVVHRALVSKIYRQSAIPEDGSQPVSENTLKSRWSRSTGRLKKLGVIGFQEPWFWWTGKPIIGMPATQPQRYMFDDPVDHGMPETEFPE
ncbi:AAA family ATPase [Bradyrhizobium japonicum]|uniref:AAA family ATPase n=1 Tax=Bradyrhizobium japonicum TaxID=375 RepID=UPI0004626B51|nr:AAA family ATPase [Bradyrhizobium japonicum]